ncbi:hypothetical protein CRM22_000572, partial [Opisthorchis felineus]
ITFTSVKMHRFAFHEALYPNTDIPDTLTKAAVKRPHLICRYIICYPCNLRDCNPRGQKPKSSNLDYWKCPKKWYRNNS